MSDDQIKIISWISGLDLEDAQKVQRPLSTFLKGFTRIKKHAPNVCRISPCHKHQYSRGVCADHYRQLKAISKIVGWGPLAKLGLCRASSMKDAVLGKRSNAPSAAHDESNKEKT